VLLSNLVAAERDDVCECIGNGCEGCTLLLGTGWTHPCISWVVDCSHGIHTRFRQCSRKDSPIKWCCDQADNTDIASRTKHDDGSMSALSRVSSAFEYNQLIIGIRLAIVAFISLMVRPPRKVLRPSATCQALHMSFEDNNTRTLRQIQPCCGTYHNDTDRI
jgi:hypothetical protein